MISGFPFTDDGDDGSTQSEQLAGFEKFTKYEMKCIRKEREKERKKHQIEL